MKGATVDLKRQPAEDLKLQIFLPVFLVKAWFILACPRTIFSADEMTAGAVRDSVGSHNTAALNFFMCFPDAGLIDMSAIICVAG